MCGERAVTLPENGCSDCAILERKIDQVASDLDECCTEVKGRLDTDETNISNLQNQLLNYYTMQQVNALLNNISNARIEVVETLPTSGETNVIYFVPTSGEAPDVYDEYAYINNTWEKIGNTEVDISNKVDISDFNRVVTQLGDILDTQCSRIAGLEDCCDDVQTKLTKTGLLNILGYEEETVTMTDASGVSKEYQFLVKVVQNG